MRAKNYLETEVFTVSAPQQPWGRREDQMLEINGNLITYSRLHTHFFSDALRKIKYEQKAIQNFAQWAVLLEAINCFVNDVDVYFYQQGMLSESNVIQEVIKPAVPESRTKHGHSI